jgi:hypothetical protein
MVPVTVWRRGLHAQEGDPARCSRTSHTAGGDSVGRTGVRVVGDGHPVDARVTREGQHPV